MVMAGCTIFPNAGGVKPALAKNEIIVPSHKRRGDGSIDCLKLFGTRVVEDS
jgi:hypothetical protein